MPTKEELLDAIKELQSKAPTYSTCEKLATFYTLLSHLYSDKDKDQQGYSYNTGYMFPSNDQSSDFKKAISGKDIEQVVEILDEHMQVVSLLFPKEYKAVIQKIDEVQK